VPRHLITLPRVRSMRFCCSTLTRVVVVSKNTRSSMPAPPVLM
jgi:hypothetical protein